MAAITAAQVAVPVGKHTDADIRRRTPWTFREAHRWLFGRRGLRWHSPGQCQTRFHQQQRQRTVGTVLKFQGLSSDREGSPREGDIRDCEVIENEPRISYADNADRGAKEPEKKIGSRTPAVKLGGAAGGIPAALLILRGTPEHRRRSRLRRGAHRGRTSTRQAITTANLHQTAAAVL